MIFKIKMKSLCVCGVLMWCPGVMHKVYAHMYVLVLKHGGQRTVSRFLECHILPIVEIESCTESVTSLSKPPVSSLFQLHL